MEFHRWVFCPEGEDSPGTPEVYPLGHAGEEVRDPSVRQGLDLGEEGFLEQDTVRNGLVVLPWEAFGAMASEGASIFIHSFPPDPNLYGFLFRKPA